MHDDLNKVRREQLRWRLLLVLDSARPARVTESLLLGALQAAGFDVSAEGLRKHLDYLKDRSLCRSDRDGWGLTYLGIDVVEFTVDCKPGIGRPESVVNTTDRLRRERMRLRMLAVLDTSRPVSMSDNFLAEVLACASYAVTPSELRRQCDYLELRDLVQIQRGAEWLIEVTHYGTDLVEGNHEPFPGIAAPPK